MSETHISALPDIPILRIFRHLPLNDLLNSIGLVCPGWRVLVPKELIHRRSLVLSRDNHRSLCSLPEYCLQYEFPMLADIKKDDGSLMVPVQKPNIEKLKFDYVNLKKSEPSSLVNALPRITHLTIVSRRVTRETVEKLIDLLYSNCRETLISLTIDFHIIFWGCYQENDVLLGLLMAINQLRSLQHLRLRLTEFTIGDVTCGSNFKAFSLLDNFELTILPRLKTLCIQTDIDDPSWFFNSLQFVPNDAQPKICFHDCVDIRKFVRLQRSSAHQQAQQFVNISTNAVGRGRMMREICAGYSSLTTLSLTIEAFEMIRLPRDLRRLQNLIALKLTLTQSDANPNDHVVDRPINAAAQLHQGWPILLENPAPLEENDQVPSVRLLHLDLAPVSHENLAALRIPEVFPNVQAINLELSSLRCHLCKYDYNIQFSLQLDDKEKDKVDKCLRMSRQTLKDCGHLRTVQYCPLQFCQEDQISVSPQQL